MSGSTERSRDPVARTEKYLSAIATENPRLNAYVTVTAGLAREQAARSQARLNEGKPLSPIDGWCIAVKDNIDVEGVRTANGLPGGRIASSDAPVVKRLKRAGAVIVGKTNLHEAALGTTTNNPHWGPTHNPHRQGYTPGGSSGGSGAAVAAGLCDAALGTDTMGSVRLPAAYCGVFGFKPTFDRVPVEGVEPLCWALDHVGPLARSMADIAAVFKVMADERKAVCALSAPRIVRLDVFEALPLSAPVAEAYARGVAALEDRWGVCPVIAAGRFEPIALRKAALLAIEADAAAIHAGNFDTASAALRSMLDYGARMPATKLATALEQMRQGRKSIESLFNGADVIVCPTAPQTAFPLDEPAPPSQADFLGLAVFAGAPAISLPLPVQGLPVGLQAIAAPGRDADLLAWFSEWPFGAVPLPEE